MCEWTDDATGLEVAGPSGDHAHSLHDQLSLRSLVMRPVATHSATKMFPEASKQASCGWTNFPSTHLLLSPRTSLVAIIATRLRNP